MREWQGRPLQGPELCKVHDVGNGVEGETMRLLCCTQNRTSHSQSVMSRRMHILLHIRIKHAFIAGFDKLSVGY